jgi:hypothetical protein
LFAEFIAAMHKSTWGMHLMSSAQDTGASASTAGGATGQQYVPRPAPGYHDQTPPARRRLAMGLTALAGVMLMLSGLWTFLAGLAAIIRGAFFVVIPNYAFNMSVSGWGWSHLILGIVVFAAGLGLFTNQLWARVAAVVLASFSAVWNFIYLPFTPVWSIVVIALDVFVIWAIMSPRHERG